MKASGSHANDQDTKNRATRIVSVATVRSVDLRALFIARYAEFALACRTATDAGLAIVAIDERSGQLAGVARLAARPARHAALIVGRHDRCDLVLAGRDELPLRQLAMILAPVTCWERGRAELGYRILDLRTAHGFVDETDRTLRGLRCDGPAVLRCGGYALYALPLGDPTDWPESGADAWACQPERVYFDEVTHVARGSSTRVPQIGPGDGRRTRVTAVPGPRVTGSVLVTGGDEVGALELIGPARRAIVPVGQAALRDGVLIGRYPRCDSACDDDDGVSRVHALLIQLDDTVLVVDTASTYGTTVNGQPVERARVLRGDVELELGRDTRARWRWLS